MTTIFDGEAIRASTLEVRKDNWSDTRVIKDEIVGGLAEDEVLLQVDRLALTANNISYAASGDALGYWRFFPAADGWGRVPAMGWADVVASNHADIVVGERVWGFFPFSTHLKILAGKVSQQSFNFSLFRCGWRCDASGGFPLWRMHRGSRRARYYQRLL